MAEFAAPLLATLRAIVGEANVLTSDADVTPYVTDARAYGWMPAPLKILDQFDPVTGPFAGKPAAVRRPCGPWRAS